LTTYWRRTACAGGAHGSHRIRLSDDPRRRLAVLVLQVLAGTYVLRYRFDGHTILILRAFHSREARRPVSRSNGTTQAVDLAKQRGHLVPTGESWAHQINITSTATAKDAEKIRSLVDSTPAFM